MPFQPLTNYAGMNHILAAAPTFIHPETGTAYAVACEQRKGAQQDLSVYRMLEGGNAWQLVKRYRGTVDSAGHITMGGAVIERTGNMLVATSLIIPGAPKITTTGFQGCWIREQGIDAPWGGSSAPAAPGGSYVPSAPRGAPLWSGQPFAGGRVVDMQSEFAVPPALAYNMRLVASGPVGARLRVGPDAATAYDTTINIIVAGQEHHAKCAVNAGPGGTLYVSTVGAISVVWLQCCGWWV